MFIVLLSTGFAENNSTPKLNVSVFNVSSDCTWPKFRNDIQNKGQSNFTGPSSPDLIWKYKTDKAIYSSPAIDNTGNIYIGSQDSYLYSISPDGSLNWKYKTGDTVCSSPAIDKNGDIYFGSFDNYLYALTSSGNLKWKFKTDGWVWSSPTISPDGTVYFGSADEYLYALTLEGELKWKYKTNFTVFSSPAIDKKGNVYIGSQDNYLYVINPKGGLKWKYKTDDWIDSSPVISNDGTIYIGADDDYLQAITSEGILKWRYKTDNDVWSSPAVGKNGDIYIGSDGKYLCAISPDGNLKWKYAADSYISSPITDYNSNIYFGSFDHYLYCLNPNGELIWEYKTDDWIVAHPAIGYNKTIYIGNEDGFLYAFQDKSSNSAIQNTKASSSNDLVNNYTKTDDDCCSVIIHSSNGHDVVSFRRDSTEAADLYIIKDKWYGKDVLKEYKTTGQYFSHNIITDDGWIICAGGGGTNSEMEKLAGEIMLRGTITQRDIQKAQTLLTKQQIGHFIIKSPQNLVGITISNGKNRLSKIFTMMDGTFICVPNNPKFYREGFYLSINTDPVEAAIYIAGTDLYGINRRNIMTYEVKNDSLKNIINVWASFDGGALIGILKGNPDNVNFLGRIYNANILPKIPDKLFLGMIGSQKAQNEIPQSKLDTVNSKTITMQKTGLPLILLMIAFLIVFAGSYKNQD